MLPQNKFQDAIFTIFMAFVMVYAMICYNIALNFPRALCWQLFVAGPFVRNVFGFFVKKFSKDSHAVTKQAAPDKQREAMKQANVDYVYQSIFEITNNCLLKLL